MGKFTAQMFQDLADVSDATPSDPGSFGKFQKDDIQRLVDFKNMSFKILMLRAKQFVSLANQETGSDDSDRFALVEMSYMITSEDLHGCGVKGACRDAAKAAATAAATGGQSSLLPSVLDKMGNSKTSPNPDLTKLAADFSVRLACHNQG